MAISKIGSKALVDCSVAAVDIADGSITNAKLTNTSITVNGNAVSLGGSVDLKAIDWQAVVTTNTTMVAGRGYFVNTTSGAITMTLPASASAGDTIAIKDYAGTFNTNNLTIGRNGHNIQGVANDSLISTNRASLILVYSDATKGWLYTVESNVADLENAGYTSATGGTVTTSGDYKIHTFTGDGCFVVSTLGFGGPGNLDKVDYLVVAGGGGGGGGSPGSNQGAGGGGAGGFRVGSICSPSAPPLSSPGGLSISATTYPITVGAGGAGAPICQATGSSGSPSVFSTITSTAGGFGKGRCAPSPFGGGAPGGSGGGGIDGQSGGTGNTPPVSPSQGNNGGNSGPAGSGGGGGASTAGTVGGGSGPGVPGGAGEPVTGIFGNSPQPFYQPTNGVYSGGGGGGGTASPSTGGSGGTGGGGAGGGMPGGCTPGINYGSSAVANTGGGGGGGSGRNSPAQPGGAGGSGGKGIVIIRYKYQ